MFLSLRFSVVLVSLHHVLVIVDGVLRLGYRNVPKLVRNKSYAPAVMNRRNKSYAPALKEGLQIKMKLMDRSNNFTKWIYGSVGESLLETAHANGINVDGTCSGDLACTTCHCVLGAKDTYEDSLGTLTSVENDLLASAFDVQATSRLSCQVLVTPEMEGMEIVYPNETSSGKRHQVWDSLSDFSGGLDDQDFLRKSFEFQMNELIEGKKFKTITKSAIPRILTKRASEISSSEMSDYIAMSEVLPFRTNNYVIDELIDWKNIPADPMFQLTFPQPGMLPKQEKKLEQIGTLKQDRKTSRLEVREVANSIRNTMNPHPGGQKDLNVPVKKAYVEEDEGDFNGMQHKYRETVLFFPSESQYCHSYCTYCFRWAQFVGDSDLQFASNDVDELIEYLGQNKEVSDILITGGDPMVLSSVQLARYLDAILDAPELEHIKNIRFGSKSLAYWPYKFTTDADAFDLLGLFKRVVDAGKHVSFMAHFSHPVELSTPAVQQAIKNIQQAGVTIRTQAPVVNHVNNKEEIWVEMWRKQISLGLIPYYMFVERDTGAKDWFGIPLAEAFSIYSRAIQKVSGLARTVRGPSMSCGPGKVAVQGIEEVAGEKVFVLKFLQARNPEWTERIFFAAFDPDAKWMDELKPAFGEEEFFFEAEYKAISDKAMAGEGSSGQFWNQI